MWYSINIVENTNHSPSAKQTHAIKYIIDMLGFVQTNVIFVRKFAIERTLTLKPQYKTM